MPEQTNHKSPSQQFLIEMTRERYKTPIKYDYALRISQMKPSEIYDNYNPGSTKPDGSVNFECHCVGHLVGSPCGFEFRKVMLCQKAVTDEETEKGACADEFMAFMQCAMETKCFRVNDENERKD